MIDCGKICVFCAPLVGIFLIIGVGCKTPEKDKAPIPIREKPSLDPGPSSEGALDNGTKQAPTLEDKESSPDSHENNRYISPVSRKYFGALPYKPIETNLIVEPKKNANVLLIVLDALNAKHLGVYGYLRDTSPHLDKLAKRGLVLTNYVSNSSWTRPSYTTIITGLSKREHGVELEGGWRLRPEITTIAERFKRAGYRTAGVTGNVLVRKSWGFDQGYQVYEDSITLNLKAFPRDNILINRAIEWLKGVRSKPFFLSLFLTSSHPPYRPPKGRRKFLSELPEGTIIEHPFREYKKKLPRLDHERIVAAYDDEIRYMDEELQRLIDYLSDSGRLENTVVVVTADHGEIFGEHNCYLHAYHMWEPVLRVPFILLAPNLQLDGFYDERPFTHLDIVPTLLDLVGIERDDDDLAGMSIVTALQDISLNHRRIMFSQHNAHGVRRQAIRDDRYKLVHHHKVEKRALKKLDELHPSVLQPNPRDLPSLAWDKERYELYDLFDDPEELNNIFEEKKDSEEMSRLLNKLQLHIVKKNEVKELPEEMIQALINTGYLRSRRPVDKEKTQ